MKCACLFLPIRTSEKQVIKKFPKVHIKQAGSYNRFQWRTDGYVYTRNVLTTQNQTTP